MAATANVDEIVFQLITDGAGTETEIAVRGGLSLADVTDAIAFLSLSGRIIADDDGPTRVWGVAS